MIGIYRFVVFIMMMTLGVSTAVAAEKSRPPEAESGASFNDPEAITRDRLSRYIPEARKVSESDYLIGPGDVLGIEVWKDPTLTRAVVVLPDGKISFPLIGDVVAGGKSVSDVKKEIEERISRYVPDTVLTLEVKQSNSMHVYVLGRVNNPGRLILGANINVLQALAMAGGINPFAKRSQIRVFRMENSTTRIFNFDYDTVTNGENLSLNIELKRGDVVFVP